MSDQKPNTQVDEYQDIVIAVIDPQDNYGFVVTAPKELVEWMGGHCLADIPCKDFPQEVGVYVCTVETHVWGGDWEDNCPEIWNQLRNVKKVDLTPYER